MNDYQKTIMERRISEAHELWGEMVLSGFSENTVVALDFTFFSDSNFEAKNLVKQLSENYELEILPDSEPNYVIVKGTTRPYGNEFTYDQWLSWIEFMINVGFSHNCVFSTWSVYALTIDKAWTSEAIEVN